MQFIAYGEELNLVQPPKPKDPKKRWDIEWSAKVRLKSIAMMPLVANEGGDSPRGATSSKKGKKRTEPAEEQSDDSHSGSKDSGTDTKSPAKEIGNRLRGLFGL